MDLSVWFAFVVASAILLITPGPTTFYIISLALRDGGKNTVLASMGVALGDLIAISLAVLGLGILLKTSIFFFTILKVVGGMYIVYLGLKTVTNSSKLSFKTSQSDTNERLKSFLKPMLITVLNPKSIVFFIAFVPLFIEEEKSYIVQAIVIIPTFVTLGFLNAMMYSILVGYLKKTILKEKIVRNLHRLTGGILITFGLGLLAYDQTK